MNRLIDLTYRLKGDFSSAVTEMNIPKLVQTHAITVQSFAVAASERILQTELCSHIIPGKLLLGSINFAKDLPALRQAGVTHVLAITQHGERLAYFKDQGLCYHTIEIKDLPSADIWPHLAPAVSFIDSA